MNSDLASLLKEQYVAKKLKTKYFGKTLDEAKFELAKVAGLANLSTGGGIGTLGERSLHSIMKFWVEGNSDFHEIPLGVGRIVADVFDGEVVTEIQTRNFSQLAKKLPRLLNDFQVNVIYPLSYTKSITWVDPETGEMSKPRMSPKRGNIWDCFYELCSIRDFLVHENLQVTVVFLNMQEYKLLNGWGNGGKRGAHRIERTPTELVSQHTFCGHGDYSKLLTENISLPNKFSVKEFSKETKLTARSSGRAIYSLYTSGVLNRCEKRGNAFLYEIADI